MVKQKQAVSVLNKLKKRDSWFLCDYSVNPYEGCSCNCQYCYVRGSKYGENMDEGLLVKSNLPEVLEKQLQSRAKRNQYGIVVVGSATDAYIHHEKEWRMTEKILHLLLKYRFPVFISTKCDLVLRDIAILKEIDKVAILPDDLKHSLGRGVIFSVSLSTLDENLAAALEPGAIAPMQRLKLLQQMKGEGFLCGVNAIPTLPFISDTAEAVEQTIALSKSHGADYILAGSLTLFGNDPADSRTLFYKFLERHRPDLLGKYKAIYRDYSSPSRSIQDELTKKVNQYCKEYNLRNRIIE